MITRCARALYIELFSDNNNSNDIFTLKYMILISNYDLIDKLWVKKNGRTIINIIIKIPNNIHADTNRNYNIFIYSGF